MRHLWIVAPFVALVVIGVQGRADDKDAKGAEKLVGTWTVTGEESGGVKAAADKIKGKEVKITRDKITCNDGTGKCEMECTYEVDTSATPWKLTLTCTEGEHKGKKLKGIAEVEGDTLKVCYAKPDTDAPTGFTTKEGQCCVTLTRAAK